MNRIVDKKSTHSHRLICTFLIRKGQNRNCPVLARIGIINMKIQFLRKSAGLLALTMKTGLWSEKWISFCFFQIKDIGIVGWLH